MSLVEVVADYLQFNNESMMFSVTLKSYHETNLLILSSVFSSNTGIIALEVTLYGENYMLVSIKNTNFTSNTIDFPPIVTVTLNSMDVDVGCFYAGILLDNVHIANNSVLKGGYNYNSVSGVFSIESLCAVTNVTMIQVTVTSNLCQYGSGSTIYIKSAARSDITFRKCTFFNNTAVRGAAVYVDGYYEKTPYPYKSFDISILSSMFDFNKAHSGIIYTRIKADFSGSIDIVASEFTNNNGGCLFTFNSNIILIGNVLFQNNSAESGGALHIDDTSIVEIKDGALVQFIDNSAVIYGGAIFVDLSFGCEENHVVFQMYNASVLFINSKLGYGGNSLYFSISELTWISQVTIL